MAANAIDLQPYASLNDEDCDERIARAKEALGDRLVNQVSVAKMSPTMPVLRYNACSIYKIDKPGYRAEIPGNGR